MVKVFKNVYYVKLCNVGVWYVNFINGYFLEYEISIKIREFNFVLVIFFVWFKVSSNSLYYFWCFLFRID